MAPGTSTSRSCQREHGRGCAAPRAASHMRRQARTRPCSRAVRGGQKLRSRRRQQYLAAGSPSAPDPQSVYAHQVRVCTPLVHRSRGGGPSPSAPPPPKPTAQIRNLRRGRAWEVALHGSAGCWCGQRNAQGHPCTRVATPTLQHVHHFCVARPQCEAVRKPCQVSLGIERASGIVTGSSFPTRHRTITR